MEGAKDATERVLVERPEYVAPRAEPLRHLQAEPATDQRLGPAVEDVVHTVEVPASNLEDVAETFGREERSARARPLEEGVDPDRGAVDHHPAVAEVRVRLIHAGEHALKEVARRAERLRVGDRAGRLVEHDEVGEGAADVDPDAKRHVRDPGAAAGCRECGREARAARRPRAAANPDDDASEDEKDAQGL